MYVFTYVFTYDIEASTVRQISKSNIFKTAAIFEK